MLKRIAELAGEIPEIIKQVSNPGELEELRVKYLGKKGEITTLLRSMGKQPPAERPVIGKKANELRQLIEGLLEQRQAEMLTAEDEKRWLAEKTDVTLPGIPLSPGSRHPLTIINDEIKDIFTGMGFRVAEGPEVELDYYSFEALNIPQDHPARDMQDTFYITPGVVLRPHTSPVQVRVMEKVAPALPVRIIAPGKVYRRDDDATHSPMFQQVEGLAVDQGITFANLKGVLLEFAREMFGPRQKIRLRPSYFPFTEPSAEVDISCVMCQGDGCRVCSHTGWLEILGAGMVHPNVLRVSGYDPEEVTGFAFGMGVERIAMLKFGIDDLRLFYANDLRMLKQF